jgi:hypothetical protein
MVGKVGKVFRKTHHPEKPMLPKPDAHFFSKIIPRLLSFAANLLK